MFTVMFDPPLTLIDGKFPQGTFFVIENDHSVAGLSHVVDHPTDTTTWYFPIVVPLDHHLLLCIYITRGSV